jgi:hypothetical protein
MRFICPTYLACMKRWFFLFLLFFVAASYQPAKAQKISKSDLAKLRLIDDSLGEYGSRILDDVVPGNRLRADSMFTRILVRALLVPYSFYYQFDSLQTAPVIYPADSSFRLITWHYTVNDADYHQRGALQMNTPDGSLKLFPLYDVSDYSTNMLDSIRTPSNWIGAVYYRIIQKEWEGKKVYTLLGYDENSDRTTRKWIELLTFNDRNEPRWGGTFADSTGKAEAGGKRRFVMEYKKEASAKLNYDEEEDMIVMDHLISQTNEPDKKYTLVPGGDYEGFRWKNGHWVNEPRLFVDNLGDGNEPKPALILNDEGIPDDAKLMEQSEKNMGEASKPKTETKPKATPKKTTGKKKD